MTARRRAIGQSVAMFIGFQTLSYFIIRLVLGNLVSTRVWLHGLAGPFNTIEAFSKFRYHSAWENGLYVLVALLIIVASVGFSLRPQRSTLMLTVGGMVAWTLFGLLQSVHHM